MAIAAFVLKAYKVSDMLSKNLPLDQTHVPLHRSLKDVDVAAPPLIDHSPAGFAGHRC